MDAICDGEMVLIGGIMGTSSRRACTPVTPHVLCQPTLKSGNSGCDAPAGAETGLRMQVRGLMNVQFAVKNNEVYLMKLTRVRRVPFRSSPKPPAYAGESGGARDGRQNAGRAGRNKEVIPPYYSVKEVVLPFNKSRALTRC